MADRGTQTDLKVDMIDGSTQAEGEVNHEQKFKYIFASARGECFHSRSSCVALSRSAHVKKLRECKFCGG